MSKINVEKFNAVEIPDTWVGWNDYIIKSINPKYGYFNEATIHLPIKQYLNSNDISFQMGRIILHRKYDRSRADLNFESGDSEQVYRGFINSTEDLEYILTNLGII